MHDQNKRLNILTTKEIQILYGIPQFTPEERIAYFTLDPLEEEQLKNIRYMNAAVYFILQLGYFKAKKQFFFFDSQDVSDDIKYILQRYFLNESEKTYLTISKPGYCYVSCHQGQSFLTVGSDLLPVAVSFIA